MNLEKIRRLHKLVSLKSVAVRCVCVVVLFYAVRLTAPDAHAQDVLEKRNVIFETTLELGLVNVDHYERTLALTATPALTILLGSGVLRSRAAVSRFESGRLTGFGDLYLGYHIGQLAGVKAAIEAEAGIGTYRGKRSSHFFQSGVVLGIGTGLLGRFQVARAFDTAVYTAVSAMVSAPVQKKQISILPSLRLTHARERYLGQIFLETSYEAKRFRLATHVGATTDPNFQKMMSARPSSSISAAIKVLPFMSVTALAGSLPPDFERGVSAARQISLGITYTNNLKEVSTVASYPQGIWVQGGKDDSLRYLTLHLSDARTVEVKGSFTGWKPLSMRKADNGIWNIPVILKTGVYSVSIRVNSGIWQAPPGLVTAKDEFGEYYGLMVVK